MYKDIFDYVFKISDQGKILSLKDLEYLFSIVKDYYKLDGIINTIKINDEINYNGVCGFKNKRIDINIGLIRSNPIINTIYGTNLTILRTFFHEIEHCKQFKSLYEKKTLSGDISDLDYFLNVYSFKSLLLSFKNRAILTDDDIKYFQSHGIDFNEEDYLKKLSEINKKYYRYAPNERMASIQALNEIKKLVKYYDGREFILDSIQYHLNNAYLRGYEKREKELCIYSPSYRYVREMKIVNGFNMIKSLENKYLDFVNSEALRMYYGVHVNEDYINEKKEKTKELKRKLEIE